jgi:lipoate-protein ligase A
LDEFYHQDNCTYFSYSYYTHTWQNYIGTKNTKRLSTNGDKDRKMKWRIIDSGKASAARNMAIDEAIFNQVMQGKSLPTIRFYNWQPPTLSFGYNQKIAAEIDLERLEKYNFDYVRRPTGGRLVLHYDEVTYSVIAPTEQHLSGSILQTYSQISQVLLAGLKNMGVEADFEKKGLSAQHQREPANPCFTSSSRFELNFNRKKIVGSAQVRKNNTLLQHGSILLNHDQSLIAEFMPKLTEEQRNRFANLLKKKSVAINQIVEQPKSYHEAVQSFITAFKQKWAEDVFVISNSLSKNEIEKTKELERSKYGSTDWNKRK